MRTCAKCGHANQDDALFCGGCGEKFQAHVEHRRKIPAEYIKYIVGAAVLIVVGLIALFFMFGGRNNQPPQTPLGSSTNIQTPTKAVRKVSSPSPRPIVQAASTCQNVVQVADFQSGITLNATGTNCVSFSLNSGQTSPWIHARGTSFSITAPGKQPFKTLFSNGAVYEAGTNQTVNTLPETNDFQIQAEQDNTQFTVTIH